MFNSCNPELKSAATIYDFEITMDLVLYMSDCSSIGFDFVRTTVESEAAL